MAQVTTRKEKKCGTVVKGNNIEIMLGMAQKCFSLRKFFETFDDSFFLAGEALNAKLAPDYPKSRQEVAEIYEKVGRALPDELKKEMTHLDIAWNFMETETRFVWLALGIVMGLKLNGASDETVAKVCRTLEVD